MLYYCLDSHRPLIGYTVPTISKEEILRVQFSIKTLLATISCSKHAGILAISRPNLLPKSYTRVLLFVGMSRLLQATKLLIFDCGV